MTSGNPSLSRQPKLPGNPTLLASCWPLIEQTKRFDLGVVLNSAITDMLVPENVGDIAPHHAGCWECDLVDNSLIWSGGVYDLFGLPRGIEVIRDDVVGLYSENSRSIMDSLRAYGIKNHVGFTLDVEISPASGGRRWMRLIGAPAVEDGRAVKLHGLKFLL